MMNDKYILDGHKIGRKVNLVTQSDKNGTYDERECKNCGRRFKIRGIEVPSVIAGKCKVSKEVYDKLMKEKASVVIFGGWITATAKIKCTHCGTKLELCPREGHPNSKFWKLEQNDGMELYICPKGCPE
jgi:DNA-directed RNA polymerase subunit RPC12/RpoP